MSQDPNPFQPMFHFDVSADSSGSKGDSEGGKDDVVIALLRQLVIGQEQQTKLLQEMAQLAGAAQKQRATELGQWKEANPHLAETCRIAAETLSRVQNQFLRNLTDEVLDNEENLVDGEFMMNEFVDRFGPRLAHLNGLLQVLSQLSVPQDSANSTA